MISLIPVVGIGRTTEEAKPNTSRQLNQTSHTMQSQCMQSPTHRQSDFYVEKPLTGKKPRHKATTIHYNIRSYKRWNPRPKKPKTTREIPSLPKKKPSSPSSFSHLEAPSIPFATLVTSKLVIPLKKEEKPDLETFLRKETAQNRVVLGHCRPVVRPVGHPYRPVGRPVG